ncbi:RNA polymerase sigma-70 factor [Sphingobacterium faecale]|uniref:RNA polymerase sigma-70 factor n=1 Tax=Sphingobacterium faecale TaxID=2803775 RepID=A0ABS1R547_9SPHI|nr:RNA polymerase sigma-70 factor [Sphingobacterium faecale]MBL1409812.1 RNA polymerase sigma-70 factor [Sphingobacterium faecale]
MKNDQEELKALQLAIADRDEMAFRQFFERFFNPLVNYAFTYTLDRTMAEDIVSELMLVIWSMEDKLNEIKNIQHYIYKATKNRSLNACAKKPTYQHKATAQEDSAYLSPENILISKESHLEIQKAIENLPPKCRTVFILIRDNQMSYKEVADLLDISVHTVNRHLQDALKKLHNKLIK